jgi:peptidoglycan-associated lipoprotein
MKKLIILLTAAACLIASQSCGPKKKLDLNGGTKAADSIAAARKKAYDDSLNALKRASVDTSAINLDETQNPDSLKALFADIRFEYDHFDLRPDAIEALGKMAAWLSRHPESSLSIEGHCDEIGSNEYNMVLGQKRADAVKEYFTSYGLTADRLRTISFGEEKPLCPGHSDEDRACNRRAHFVVK